MLPVESIASRIITIRGLRVMLDSDLAALYEAPTKRFNEAVKRNANRFPNDFMFQLTQDEWDALRSQFATLNADAANNTGRGQHRKYLPFVFTEHGALMAAMILKSERAVEVSVYVVRAFVQLRSLLAANEQLAAQLKALEKRIAQRLSTHDQAIAGIIDTLRKLMQANEQRESTTPAKRPIGFVHPKDNSPTPKQRSRRTPNAKTKATNARP
jgi:phage regulator Rha-like protein